MISFQIRPIILIAMVLALILVAAQAPAEEKKAPAGKAAVVNGVPISKDDFDRELDFFIKRANMRGQQVPEAQMGMMKNQVLDGLIDRELLYQESKKKGIKVDPKEVSDQFQQIKQRYPSEDEFKKLLGEMDLTVSDV